VLLAFGRPQAQEGTAIGGPLSKQQPGTILNSWVGVRKIFQFFISSTFPFKKKWVSQCSDGIPMKYFLPVHGCHFIA
jgi:hypothetical protein